MDNMMILIQLLAVLPSAIEAGIDVANTVSTIRTIAERGTPPTSEEWDMLNAHVKELRAALNKDPG